MFALNRNRLIYFSLFLAFCNSAPAEERIKATTIELSDDLQNMQGEWRNTLTAEYGKKLGDEEQKKENRTVFIKGNNFRMERFKNGKFGFHEGVFKIDPEKHFFDLEEPSGQTCVGIYSLDGDTLKFCYRIYQKGNAPAERPTEFKSTPERPSAHLYEYKKVK